MLQTTENILSRSLDPSERLLWSGQPRGGVRLRAADAYLIPFSLLWGGFAIFWEFMVVTQISHAPNPVGIIFPLFGLPFVCIGLYLIFGRFFVDARTRECTFYGVTPDRILIVSGVFSQQTKSLQLRTLTDVTLTQRNDGSGTITFGPTFSMGPFSGFGGFGSFGGWPGARRFTPPSFELIENAKEVYDIIRNAQKKSGAG